MVRESLCSGHSHAVLVLHRLTLAGFSGTSAFDEAKQGQALIYIPSIVLAELYFLNEKKGRPIDYSGTFALLTQSAQFVLLPFEPIDNGNN